VIVYQPLANCRTYLLQDMTRYMVHILITNGELDLLLGSCIAG
jgi:hypothetical protein